MVGLGYSRYRSTANLAAGYSYFRHRLGEFLAAIFQAFQGRRLMPKVGGKHYSYSAKGQKAAKAAAKRTGQKITSKKPKKK